MFSNKLTNAVNNYIKTPDFYEVSQSLQIRLDKRGHESGELTLGTR